MGSGSTGSSGNNASSTVPQSSHVFLIVEENQSYTNVIGNPAMPYLNSLAGQYALATNYFANFHPSLPNYFMLSAGELITFNDGFSGTVSNDNIVRELIAAGKTWKAYAESLPSVGYAGTDAYPYLERHDPLSFFSDVRNSAVQRNNLVPFSQFAIDLKNGQLPDFSFITPNAEDDAHDCPSGGQDCDANTKLAAADGWLKTNIAPLLSNSAFQTDGILIIVFDESVITDIANGGGHVAMLVIGPKVKKGFQSTKFYQHQNTLRTLLEAAGASNFPGDSASAADMAEFFQ
jgi:acid phosphatase